MNSSNTKITENIFHLASEKLELLQILKKNISSLCENILQGDVEDIALHIDKQQEYMEMINTIDEKYNKLIKPYAHDGLIFLSKPWEETEADACPEPFIKIFILLQKQQLILKNILELNNEVIIKGKSLAKLYKQKMEHTENQKRINNKFNLYGGNLTGVVFDYKEKGED